LESGNGSSLKNNKLKLKKILLVGGSYGLGNAISSLYPEKGDILYIISRSSPKSLNLDDGVARKWINVDLSMIDSSKSIFDSMNENQLDQIIYCAGTWEKDLNNLTALEIHNIINTNLTSFITMVHEFTDLLKKAKNPLIVAIGSTAGLENIPRSMVSYASSKFGLRGAVQAYRHSLKKYNIKVSIIIPGGIATDVSIIDNLNTSLQRYGNSKIPMSDIVKTLKFISELSPASNIREIIMPAFDDNNV
jgi:short-subunit dehydrogenase